MQQSSSSSSLDEKDAIPLPIGVTVRSRRRNQRLASSKSITDDVVINNKENNQTRRNTDTAATSKRRGKTKSVRSDRNQVEEEEGKDDKHEHDNDSNRLFQTTLKSIALDLMLRHNHGLADQVLQASRSMSSSSSKKQLVASLALEEHENELLNDCRTLIKSVTDKDAANTFVLESLYVTVHILRALASFQYHAKRQEATLKLLYHIATLASDQLKLLDSSCKGQVMVTVICVAALEAMGRLLKRYSIESTSTSSKSSKTIAFIVLENTQHDDNHHNNWSQKIFPRPTFQRTRNGSAAKNCGTLPPRKVVALNMQMAMAVFMALVKLETTFSFSDSSASSNDMVSDFGSFPRRLLMQVYESTSIGRLQFGTSLFDDIVVPWIHFFAELIGPECFDEILLHGKRAHRSLWEAAAASQVTASSSTATSTNGQELALQLRQRSVMALLLCPSNDVPLPYLRSILAEKLFDSACAYAWKAVATFRSGSSESNPSVPLRSFHEEVGPVLDALHDEGGESFAYAEYCTYRALHLGPGHADVQRFYRSNEYLEQSTSVAIMGETTFDQFLLALTLSRGFESLGCTDDGMSNFSSSDVGHLESVRDRFRSTVLTSSDIGQLNRCCKMLALASLSRSIYNVLKDNAWVPRPTECSMLYYAGKILADCMGPLCVKLLSCKSQTKAEMQRFWETSVESFIRALTALVRISTSKPSNINSFSVSLADINDESESMAIQLVDLLIGETGQRNAPAECLEKAAKSLSVVGKRYLDQGEHSRAVLPFVLSVQLFTRLSFLTADRSDVNKQQLSVRWFHLASVFQSNGMVDEACTALVAALTLLAHESADDMKLTTSLELIHRSASLTKGGFVTGTSISESHDLSGQIISRLISLFCQREPSVACLPNSKVAALTVSSAILMLSASMSGQNGKDFHDMFESKCAINFTFTGLLRAMFVATSDCKGQGSRNEGILSYQVKIMIEIVVGLGLRYQLMSCRDPDLPSSVADQEKLLEEFQNLLRLVPSLIRKLMSLRGEPISLLLVPFYVVAAHCLHPNLGLGLTARNAVEVECDERTSKLPSFGVAQRVLNKAKDACKRSETRLEPEWEAMLAAMALVVSAYHMQLNRIMQLSLVESDAQHLQLCLDATKSLENITKSSPMLEASRSCLLWELFQFHGRLRFDGHWLAAACIARCIHRLGKLAVDGEDRWSRAIVISSAMKADIPLIECDVLNTPGHIQFLPAAVGETQWLQLAQTELASVQIRFNMVSTFDNDLRTLTMNAIAMFDSLEMQEPTHLVQWVSGSVAETISELFERSGDVRESLRWIRRCVRICRMSLEPCNVQRDHPFSTPSSLPLWIQATLATKFARLSERHFSCLQRISLLYAKLGNHRKSEGYAMTAAENLDMSTLRGESQSCEIVALASSSLASCGNNRELASRRLLVQVKAQAMALDAVAEAFTGFDVKLLDVRQRHSVCADIFFQNRILDRISSLLVVGDSLYGGISLLKQTQFVDFYQEACTSFKELPVPSQMLGMDCFQRTPQQNRIFQMTYSRLKLREVRSIMQTSNQHEKAALLCSEVVESPWSSPDCRAWAFYYLGLLDLGEARAEGCLSQLWLGCSNLPCNSNANQPGGKGDVPSLSKARENFLSALCCSGLTPSLLSRNALRCLALVTGPTAATDPSGFSAAAFIQSSIGMLPRQSVFCAFADAAGSGKGGLAAELLCALDTNLLDQSERNRKIALMYKVIANRLPKSWRSLSMCLCPTGEILMAAMDVVHGVLTTSTACVFPEISCDNPYESKIYNDVLKPLDRLIEKNQLQLRGNEDTAELQQPSDDSTKRQWWKMRSSLDCELGELIDGTERNYFSGDSIRQIVVGVEKNTTDEASELSCGNLADKFEAAVDFKALQRSLDYDEDHRQIDAMTAKLESLSISRPSQALGGGNRLSQGEPRSPMAIDSGVDESDEVEECLFLILDENLHRFPFEGMSSFEGRAVCRVPSLPFVVLPLVEAADAWRIAELDPFGASFILDPESNLSETKNRLLPVIQSISSINKWEWKGVIGSNPSKAFIEKALKHDNGLLLYCGHGAGQVFYPRKSVERLLMNTSDEFGEVAAAAAVGTRLCRASVILMGCSSGRLVSVNRKNSKTHENLPVHFEPEGIALSYLCAGAPCVVGNLWDVTDRDIDRYSVALLNNFLGKQIDSDRQSLSQSVAEARVACKLRYLVGCAPVCYGIPVRVLASKTGTRYRHHLDARESIG